ncbi:MAG TPA: hypothetical protein VGR84_11130, partial [Candidatus Acidoferrales bacterium]|nr:hypothetical protein [Candidatus Acidoferrales bacterium]
PAELLQDRHRTLSQLSDSPPWIFFVQRLVAALRHTFNPSQSQQLSHPFSASSTSPKPYKKFSVSNGNNWLAKTICEQSSLRTTAAAPAQILPVVLVYLRQSRTKFAPRLQEQHSINGTELLIFVQF